MTREQISTMPAGRELDVEIERRVFGRDVGFEQGYACGWRVKKLLMGEEREPVSWYPNDYIRLDYSPERDGVQAWALGPDPRIVPQYSTDIAAGWRVVERMRELRFSFDAGSGENVCDGNDWVVEFKHSSAPHPKRGLAPTFPLAICRAALVAHLAQGAEKEEE